MNQINLVFLVPFVAFCMLFGGYSSMLAETTPLHEKTCIPCQGRVPPLNKEEIQSYIGYIDSEMGCLGE